MLAYLHIKVLRFFVETVLFLFVPLSLFLPFLTDNSDNTFYTSLSSRNTIVTIHKNFYFYVWKNIFLSVLWVCYTTNPSKMMSGMVYYAYYIDFPFILLLDDDNDVVTLCSNNVEHNWCDHFFGQIMIHAPDCWVQ